jgi:hypothetical protein
MHTTHNVQHPQNLSTHAPASTDEATMNMPDKTTVTLNGASTSVPEPTAAAAPLGIAVLSMPDGTTLTVYSGSAPENFRTFAPVTNNFHSGAVYNATTVEAGATVNTAERQTIYTGGGAPNGTGSSPTVSASALEAAVGAAIADLTKLCQDIQENVTGQGERLQTTMAEQFEEHESSIKAFVRKTLQEPVAAYQTPMTGVPNRQPYSAS